MATRRKEGYAVSGRWEIYGGRGRWEDENVLMTSPRNKRNY
jgi:hypothetical protein